MTSSCWRLTQRQPKGLKKIGQQKPQCNLEMTIHHQQFSPWEAGRSGPSPEPNWRSGLWKWKVLPFGLTSACLSFRVLHELHWKKLLLYLDEIIVIAPHVDTHIQWLEEVFQWLPQARLKLKPSRVELLQSEVCDLWHTVNIDGVTTDPERMTKSRTGPHPGELSSYRLF